MLALSRIVTPAGREEHFDHDSCGRLITRTDGTGRVAIPLAQRGVAVTGIELSAPARWPKGSTWILELDGGHAWKGTYLEPLVLEPAGQDPLPR